jgi:hypothetical protein
MKLLSGGGGGIKSIQTGKYSFSDISGVAVVVPHDPVDINRSELKIYGGGDQLYRKGTGINQMGRYSPFNLSRSVDSFTHTPSYSNDRFELINDSGNLAEGQVTGIYWELIEYA